MGKKEQVTTPVIPPSITDDSHLQVPVMPEVVDDETKARVFEAYERAVLKLVLGEAAQMKFFATLVMRLRYDTATWQPTCATDGRTIWINPTFWLGLTEEQRQGVLAHEVMHCASKHFSRQQNRNLKLWNYAADMEINQIIVECPKLQLPDKALIPGRPPYESYPLNEIAEAYYALVEKSATKILVHGDGDAGGCGTFMPPGQSEAEISKSNADWDVATRQAAQVAKDHQQRTRGTIPGGFQKLIDEILAPPKIPWTSELREFFNVMARDDYSWSTPNRRHIASGIYLPSLRSQRLGDIIIALDLSGSMFGGDDLARCGVEMTAILECYPNKVHILYHDTSVRTVQEWNRYDGPIRFSGDGGGGTDHVPIFEWIKEKELEPSVLICMTDLQTRFPTEAPEYPVFWVTVSGGTAPFGRVLEI